MSNTFKLCPTHFFQEEENYLPPYVRAWSKNLPSLVTHLVMTNCVSSHFCIYSQHRTHHLSAYCVADWALFMHDCTKQWHI